MPSEQIGAQMFTLRDHCKMPADIASTLKRLREMGFETIQASAAGFNDISAEELRKILDDHGMTCAATHKSLDWLGDVSQAVEWHKTVGCELTAIGGFGAGKDGAAREQWQGFIKQFNELAPKLAAKGLKLGYHNHSHELSPFGLAQDPARIDPHDCPMQLLVDQTDPSVWFEIDTYWIAHGGGDPAAWIDKVAGRIPAVHVKDMTITPGREQKMCEVGRGNLNWPRIIEACRNAGVQYYLIERDSGDVDPFESLKISLENLKAMGVGEAAAV